MPRSVIRQTLCASMTGLLPVLSTPALAAEPVSYIVQSVSTEAAAERVLTVGGEVRQSLDVINAVSADLTADQAAELRDRPGIRVYEDRTVQGETKAGAASLAALKADVRYQFQVLSVDSLHQAGIVGRNVTVAMLDSGLWSQSGSTDDGDAEYSDDDGSNRVIAYYDLYGSKGPVVGTAASVSDPYGHGTHVTSIATSSKKDSAGFAGIAPGTRIVVVRALDGNGGGSYANVIAGVNWIVQNKAKLNIRVLNLSLGAPVQSYYWDDPLNQAVMKAWQAGIVVVAAAGNSGPAPMTINVPGNVPYVITVGAMTDSGTPQNTADDAIASFSSTGPTYEGFVKPEVVAPGGHIAAPMSTTSSLYTAYAAYGGFTSASGKPLPYFALSGTSQAAAVTTGVVALMLQSNPALTPDQVKCHLMASATPAVTPGGTLDYTVFQQGAGLINPINAIASSAENCANQGLDINADLAGTAHFGGPANQDAAGNFYVMDLNGSTYGTPLAGDGYNWSKNWAPASTLVWSSSHLKGYTWSKAYLWSSSCIRGYTWSKGYTWSASIASWNTAPAKGGATTPASIEKWVPNE
jgi:serine protease AprX